MNTTAEQSSNASGKWSVFLAVRLASGFLFAFLAAVTVSSNGFLLTVLWKKRKRSLMKSPALYFVFGVGVLDLTTGLVVEPVFSVCYLGDLSTCRTVMEGIRFLPSLLINSSYLLVLFLSWSQYLAISHPHAFKRLLTKRRVTTVVAGVLTYTTSFSLLHFTRISRVSLVAFDVSFHATFIPFVLLMSYVTVLVNLRKHMRLRQTVLFRRNNLITGDSQACIFFKTLPRSVGCVERQFISMTLMLTAVLFVCTLPSITVMHITLNGAGATFEQQTILAIAQKVTDIIFFSKFALDPLIFAWNVKKMGVRLSLHRSSSGIIARTPE